MSVHPSSDKFNAPTETGAALASTPVVSVMTQVPVIDDEDDSWMDPPDIDESISAAETEGEANLTANTSASVKKTRGLQTRRKSYTAIKRGRAARMAAVRGKTKTTINSPAQQCRATDQVVDSSTLPRRSKRKAAMEEPTDEMAGNTVGGLRRKRRKQS